MNPRAGAPWRPLALLSLGVLVLHVAALREPPRSWRPAGERLAIRLATQAATPSNPPGDTQVGAASQRRHADPGTAPTTSTPRAARAAATRSRRPAADPPTAVAPSAPAALRAALPGGATWRYELTTSTRGVPGRGDATLAWRQEADRYELALTMVLPDGRVRIQRSTGRVDASGLAPDRFSDRARSEEAAHFDRASSRVVFSSQRPSAPLQAGAQDRASVLIQLTALVAADPARWARDTRWTAQVAGTREADGWDFVAQGEELLDGPDGPLRTLRFLRAARGPYDWTLTLWLARGGDYGPVRLRLTAPGGDWLEMQWSGTDKG